MYILGASMKYISISASRLKAKCLVNSGWRHAQPIEHRINTTLFEGTGHPAALEHINPVEVHVIVFHHNIHHAL